MKRLILHIGRHKTGTTAIQRFLRTNPDLLETNHYYYPEFGIRGFGHHEIGAPITRVNLRKEGVIASELTNELRSQLQHETDDKNSTIIVSSESFQNCDPKIVKELFSGWQVNVVIYLREQIGYLISAYAQKVHASNYTGTIEAFFASSFSKTYTQFVHEWAQEFGSNLTLRVYDKEELIEQNVVVDFCESVLDIDRELVKKLYKGSDANPSLTRDLLDFKLFVNRHDPLEDRHAKLLYNGLSKLALSDKSGKIVISDELIMEMKDRFQRSNADIAKQYFHRDNLFRQFTQTQSCGTAGHSQTPLSTIRNELVGLFPELTGSLPMPAS